MKHPRSPYDEVGGIVYFGRMLDKIRLLAAGELSSDCHENLGKGFDKRCSDFLDVRYEEIRGKILGGMSDQGMLDWCFGTGRKPSAEEISTWNDFMRNRGRNDDGSEVLAQRKRESGLENRDDIQTMFDYIDVDEGRPLRR